MVRCAGPLVYYTNQTCLSYFVLPLSFCFIYMLSLVLYWGRNHLFKYVCTIRSIIGTQSVIGTSRHYTSESIYSLINNWLFHGTAMNPE